MGRWRTNPTMMHYPTQSHPMPYYPTPCYLTCYPGSYPRQDASAHAERQAFAETRRSLQQLLPCLQHLLGLEHVLVVLALAASLRPTRCVHASANAASAAT
jgi:hypothetical protein